MGVFGVKAKTHAVLERSGLSPAYIQHTARLRLNPDLGMLASRF